MEEKEQNQRRRAEWEPSGQSYKASTVVNYDSRVVSDLKIPQIMTLEL